MWRMANGSSGESSRVSDTSLIIDAATIYIEVKFRSRVTGQGKATPDLAGNKNTDTIPHLRTKATMLFSPWFKRHQHMMGMVHEPAVNAVLLRQVHQVRPYRDALATSHRMASHRLDSRARSPPLYSRSSSSSSGDSLTGRGATATWPQLSHPGTRSRARFTVSTRPHGPALGCKRHGPVPWSHVEYRATSPGDRAGGGNS
ncbi:hypothetical protein EI94DRAFT_734169 [Lactarius quietus]|nr:hypothetical protein EI94DRAFT_734169 [Lactarius quietus]